MISYWHELKNQLNIAVHLGGVGQRARRLRPAEPIDLVRMVDQFYLLTAIATGNRIAPIELRHVFSYAGRSWATRQTGDASELGAASAAGEIKWTCLEFLNWTHFLSLSFGVSSLHEGPDSNPASIDTGKRARSERVDLTHWHFSPIANDNVGSSFHDCDLFSVKISCWQRQRLLRSLLKILVCGTMVLKVFGKTNLDKAQKRKVESKAGGEEDKKLVDKLLSKLPHVKQKMKKSGKAPPDKCEKSPASSAQPENS